MSVNVVEMNPVDAVEVISRDDLSVRKSFPPGMLRLQVKGVENYANTIAYWRVIIGELQGGALTRVLLVDELRGLPLFERDWLELVVMMEGVGLDKARIAHVKPNGRNEIEFCEIYARDAGIDARVFLREKDAIDWLRARGA